MKAIPCSFGARRVLVAGVGYVGRLLAARLVEAGATVFGLSRNPEALPDAVRPVAADLTRPETLALLPGGLDAAVFLAAPGGGAVEAYRAVYVDGSRHLLEALARAGLPQRLIFASSTSVYAQEDGSWVDERSPTEPVDPRGQLLLEAEAAWGVVGGRTAVVRFGGIYGPGRTRLIEQVRSGAARLPAGPVYTNRIHREDCAGALLHLLDLAQPAPLYAGVDREPADLADVLRFIAERVGVGELAVGDGAPVRGRGGSKRVRSDRLVGTGFEFVYPTYREGYGALIDQVGK